MGKTNKITIESIKEWLVENGDKFELLSTTYIRNVEPLDLKCKTCGMIFQKNWTTMKAKGLSKCPICETKTKPCKGINTIEVTHPHMVQYFKNYEDATSNLYGSEKKVWFKCPCCGLEEYKTINKVLTRGYNCSTCGSYKSFGERLMVALLSLLKIKFKHEYKPNWSDGRKYDFYIKEYNMIVEIHGGQHYKESGRGRSLKEEQENDKYKEELAIKNGINNYIVIDSRKSDYNFIFTNIINSNIVKFIDVAKVDKKDILTLMNKPVNLEIYYYWNNKEDWETTKHLAEHFNISQTKARKILNFGKDLGLCEFDSKEEMRKNGSRKGLEKRKKVLFQGQIFNSAKELSEVSLELFGTELNEKCINSVCNGRSKTYKGFTFAYID